jgi:hypothetical protein
MLGEDELAAAVIHAAAARAHAPGTVPPLKPKRVRSRSCSPASDRTALAARWARGSAV